MAWNSSKEVYSVMFAITHFKADDIHELPSRTGIAQSVQYLITGFR
jgi:hypothetical protein